MHLGFAEDSFFKKPWVLISVTYVAKNNPGRRITINSVCNKLKNRRKKQHGFEKKKKSSVRILSFTSLSILSFTSLSVFNGEGNGTPLQYSCLENSMDGGA